MSKVVFKSPYASNGKGVGGDYINYMAKRERVDKSVNTKKVEINLNYIATRPRVEKVGEHGLFGSEDNVNLNIQITECQTFIKGFKLGARFFMECFENDADIFDE